MTTHASTPLSAQSPGITPYRAGEPAAGRTYRGKVSYLFAFDVAYDLRSEPSGTLLGQPVQRFAVDVDRRTPRKRFFFQPAMVRLPPTEKRAPHGLVRVERTVKIFPVGAITVTISVPFEGMSLTDLVAFHDLAFETGSVHAEARELAEQVRREIEPLADRPVSQMRDDEAYTVFCLDESSVVVAGDVAALSVGTASTVQSTGVTSGGGRHRTTEAWMRESRRQIAALLTQETDPGDLSEQETADTAGKYLSYYDHDLVVVDWDAALLIDEPKNFDDVLHIMELANVQLAELEAYDRLLDGAVERSYADLHRGATLGILGTGGGRKRSRDRMLRDLREIRIDLSRLSDELLNITKFFGDWHLARVYQALAARFHLPDWQRTIDEKLKTLDGMYQMLAQERTNRWMMILEAAIVLLFIIDIVWLFMGGH